MARAVGPTPALATSSPREWRGATGGPPLSGERVFLKGEALSVAANDGHVIRNNVFGLLLHLGHETAGALSFVAVGRDPAEHRPLRRSLKFEELQARIDTTIRKNHATGGTAGFECS